MKTELKVNDIKVTVHHIIVLRSVNSLGSISAALSCLVYPSREEQAPFPNSGW